MSTAKTKQPTVYIVDDHPAVRDSIRWLVQQVGLAAKTFASAKEFLASPDPDMHGCLVLDIRMPGMSGLELQEYLAVAQVSIPVIIVTGHGDVPVTVRAMKKGAFDFLQKPFNDQALLDSIFAAIRKHEEICAEKERRAEEEQNLASLTSREREVLELLRAGKSSKVIAADLDISVRTVEGHRANIMLKMNAKTVGQLIDLASKRDSAPG